RSVSSWTKALISSVETPGRMSSAASINVSAASWHARRIAAISLGDLISTELMERSPKSLCCGLPGSTLLFPRDFAERGCFVDGGENVGRIRREVVPELGVFGSGVAAEETDERPADEPRVEPLDDAKSRRVRADRDFHASVGKAAPHDRTPAE